MEDVNSFVTETIELGNISWFCVDFHDLRGILCSCAQSCLTLCDPMNCSSPGSSIHGIFYVKILEWVAIPFSRDSFWPRDQTWVSCISCIAGWVFIAEPPGKTLILWHHLTEVNLHMSQLLSNKLEESMEAWAHYNRFAFTENWLWIQPLLGISSVTLDKL